MSLPHIILGLLKTDGEKSGYDIKQDFDDGMRTFWHTDLPQIYRALNTLEKKEWVSVRDDPDNARNRKLYQLTQAGDEELIAWLSQSLLASPHRRRDLARLFFGNFLPLDHIRQQLLELKTATQAQLDAVAANIPMIESLGDHYGNHAQFWLMTVDQGVKLMQAKIDWCEACLARLDAMEAKEQS